VGACLRAVSRLRFHGWLWGGEDGKEQPSGKEDAEDVVAKSGGERWGVKFKVT